MNEKKLVEAILNEDFNETYNLLQNINNADIENTYVDFLITFIMENPDVDYGMPGPIVHFIEKHPIERYIGLLLNAIEQKPNDTLLWMLNRIINISVDLEKEQYIEILKITMERENVDEATRTAAKRFYLYQTSSN